MNLETWQFFAHDDDLWNFDEYFADDEDYQKMKKDTNWDNWNDDVKKDKHNWGDEPKQIGDL